MKYFKYLIIVSIIYCKPVNLLAWGADGHKITGKVAYSLLDQKTKDSVKFYLGNVSLENASNWMDEIRSDPKYDYMKPWHYINLENGERVELIKGENIVTELSRVIALLKERNRHSKEEVTVAIKILAHLMGDLHQPLHCGYGIDTGGNAIPVTFFKWPSNLHRVWDSEIIMQLNIKAKDCLRTAERIAKTDTAAPNNADIIGWCMESRACLKEVYNFKGHLINDQYALKNRAMVEKQLALGGLRLSRLLTEIFKS